MEHTENEPRNQLRQKGNIIKQMKIERQNDEATKEIGVYNNNTL